VHLIGSGRTAEVFEDDGYALKLFYPSTSSGLCAHEARVAAEVAGCEAAPAFYGTRTIGDRQGLLFERLPGRTLAQIAASADASLTDLAEQLARVHVEIHANTGEGLATMADAFEHRVDGFEGLSAAGRGRLRGFLCEDEGRQLCHGDLHPENVLQGDDGRLRVIDWTNAYAGSPTSDVLRSQYMLRHGLPPGQDRIGTEEQALRDELSDLYLRTYEAEAAAPLDRSSWEIWRLVVLVVRAGEGISGERAGIDSAIREITTTCPELA
jgi:hypothetical protein